MTGLAGGLKATNLHKGRAGFPALGFHDSKEFTEGEVADLPAPEFLHPLKVQILEVHTGILRENGYRGFVEPSPALVGHLLVEPEKVLFGSLTVVAAPHFFGKVSMLSAKFGEVMLIELRGIDVSALAVV